VHNLFYFALLVRQRRLFNPITYLSKLPGTHVPAALLQPELFRVNQQPKMSIGLKIG